MKMRYICNALNSYPYMIYLCLSKTTVDAKNSISYHLPHKSHTKNSSNPRTKITSYIDTPFIIHTWLVPAFTSTLISVSPLMRHQLLPHVTLPLASLFPSRTPLSSQQHQRQIIPLILKTVNWIFLISHLFHASFIILIIFLILGLFAFLCFAPIYYVGFDSHACLFIYPLFIRCVVFCCFLSPLRSLIPVLRGARVVRCALRWPWRRSLSLRTECSLVSFSFLCSFA